MPASETLELLIRARDQASGEINKLNRQLRRTEKVALATRRAFRTFGRGIAGIRRSVLSLRTAFVGLGVTLLARNLIQASNEQAESIEGLDQALRSMGRFTPELSQNLKDVAVGLQGITNFGDEAIIEGQKFLITYKGITDDLLPRTSAAMVDLAALTGKDMVSSANLLGKAALGLTSELKRSGITINDNTFAAKGFAGALAEIEAQVAGQAVAQRKATGSLVAFGNVLGDTREKIGDILKLALEPIFRVLLEEIGKLNKRIETLRKEGRLHEWAQEWAEVILKALEAISKGVGAVASSIHGWRLIFASVRVSFTGFVAELLRGARDIEEKWGGIFGKIATGLKVTAKAFKIIGPILGPQTILLQKQLEILGGMAGALDENKDKIAEGAQEWTKINVEALDHLVALESAKNPYATVTEFADGLIARMREYIKDIAQAEKDMGGLGDKIQDATASQAQMTKSAISRQKELAATFVATLQAGLREATISQEKFFEEREALLKSSFESQARIISEAATLERDPGKRLALLDKLFALEQKYARDIIKLEQDKSDARDEAEEKRKNVVETLEAAVARTVDTEDVESLFKQELAALKRKQEDELQSIRDNNASIEQENELKNSHIIEQDILLQQKQKRLAEITHEAIKSTIGGFEQAFGDLFEATGKKIKAFFLLQRAAAIANTIISTYESAQQAYKSAVQIPIIGKFIAPVAAAAAVAAGLARVAVIRAQSIAAGGEVLGFSPTTNADNIPALLTAGEFVHPVAAVKHYGASAMEAIRQRLIPKSLLQGYAAGGLARPAYAFQAGGTVPPGATSPGQAQQGRDVVIANFYDPEELTRFLATSRGQDAVVNAIAGRRETVRRVIQ